MTAADDRRKWNDRYAATLANGPHRPEPHPLALRWRRRMAGGSMLDAACGMGRGIAAAGHLFHTIYGVDLSDRVVLAARQFWLGRSIHWVVADVTQLAWPGGSLGLVCAFGFTDQPFFRRIRESIRPGGMFLYEGFSRRQLSVKPDLDPAWTATPAELESIFQGWDVLECGEIGETPFRVRIAAIRPNRTGA